MYRTWDTEGHLTVHLEAADHALGYLDWLVNVNDNILFRITADGYLHIRRSFIEEDTETLGEDL